MEYLNKNKSNFLTFKKVIKVPFYTFLLEKKGIGKMELFLKAYKLNLKKM